MKKILLFFTASLLLISNAYADVEYIVWDGETITYWTEGSGTVSDPYIISDPAHLAYLAMQVNAGFGYTDVYFQQTRSFDLNHKSWTSIGTATSPFQGHYSGYNVLIKNIANAPLFGAIHNATIRTLVIDKSDGTTPTSQNNNYAMVQQTDGACTLSDCYNWAPITSSDDVCGGLVSIAKGNSLTMIRCYNYAEITVNGDVVGGLIGLSEVDKLTLTYCHNGADLTSQGSSTTSSQKTYSGGLIGRVRAGSVSIDKCSSEGTIWGFVAEPGDEAGIGHLIGAVFDTVPCTIQRSYAKGLSYNYLVGSCTNKVQIKGCYLIDYSNYESNIFKPQATTTSCYYVNEATDIWSQFDLEWSTSASYCFHSSSLDIKRGTYVSKAEMQGPTFLDRINIDEEYFAQDLDNSNKGYPILKWQELDRYTITATCDAMRGTVKGGGQYAQGNTVTLKATPKAGCSFLGWSDGNTDNPRTITVTGDATYIAQFTKSTYTIYVNQDCTGSIE